MRTLPSLLLFARAPEPGRVKTRLASALSARGAADLYRAFLEDASRVYGGRAGWQSVLCADPSPDDPLLACLFPEPWRRVAQAAGDLGQRLHGAFEDEFRGGAPAAVAVGADHPALPRGRLAEVFASVAAGGAAVIPAEDGGYCAIGLSAAAPIAEVFREIPWSTPAVLAVTLRRMSQAGLPCRVLEPAYDVDLPEDLERLRRDLAGRDPSGEDFPSATAGALATLARGGA